MAQRLDAILVVDVEATCWEGDPPPGQISEIIEIGLCVVSVRALERVERRSILVRPASSTVSAYCTQLTTLTQADVDAGVPLADACQTLITAYKSRERVFASFGDYDRQLFESNCAAYGIAYPFGATHLNVKNLAAIVYGWSREAGMPAMLKRAGLPLEGVHHRGGDDAWNIAGLLCHFLRPLRPG